MIEMAALEFPVLFERGGGFADGVRYTVKATMHGTGTPKELVIEHSLAGTSFIRDWILSGDASFSTRLLFRRSAQRKAFRYTGEPEVFGDFLIAKQYIPVQFSYPPEISCSIATTGDQTLIVRHPMCGLTDFWNEDERIDIPGYARIGRHPLLTFIDGRLPSLIYVVCNEEFDSGSMETTVRETAPDGEKPITLRCARDVYDELSAFRDTSTSTPREAMQSAIVTQALCAVYRHMNASKQIDDEEISSALRRHRYYVKKKTDMTWGEEGFNPSLAATVMQPYVLWDIQTSADED